MTQMLMQVKKPGGAEFPDSIGQSGAKKVRPSLNNVWTVGHEVVGGSVVG
jgi:hypothetical protein